MSEQQTIYVLGFFCIAQQIVFLLWFKLYGTRISAARESEDRAWKCADKANEERCQALDEIERLRRPARVELQRDPNPTEPVYHRPKGA